MNFFVVPSTNGSRGIIATKEMEEKSLKLLDFVKPKLKAEGVELRVRVFNDYVQPSRPRSTRQSTPTCFGAHRKQLKEAFNLEEQADFAAGKVAKKPYTYYSY